MSGPEARWLGPIVVFLLVLALFAWAAALHRLGAN